MFLPTEADVTNRIFISDPPNTQLVICEVGNLIILSTSPSGDIRIIFAPPQTAYHIKLSSSMVKPSG